MRFAILGSGAVGGYFGAKLARAGQEVAFVARGAHLEAIRARGLEVRSPALGDFTVRAAAESDTSRIGQVDVVIVAVKTYDNATALPLIEPLLGRHTAILTLQNGVDSVDDISAVAGADRVLGGATYVATALEAPGLIVQTGVHRSIFFGEARGGHAASSPRVEALAAAFAAADIEARAVPDGRVPVWDKFVYLVPFSGFTGAARLPFGPLWAIPHVRDLFHAAAREVAGVAAAEGVTLSPDRFETLRDYLERLPGSTRSSLLIDLAQGKRIEVEALQGAAVRRAAKHGLSVPIVSTLYAVLKPWASGPVRPQAAG